jgi:hypothetical protein
MIIYKVLKIENIVRGENLHLAILLMENELLKRRNLRPVNIALLNLDYDAVISALSDDVRSVPIDIIREIKPTLNSGFHFISRGDEAQSKASDSLVMCNA